MAPNDWKHELNHLLDSIEKQSTESLDKMDQQFMTLGLSFDDDFQENVQKMVKLR